MNPFDMVKQQLTNTVPFAKHTGVVIDDSSPEGATCHLDQRPEVENHIQSMHAGALFVLGEQASGAAFAGAFLDRMMTVRPVAAEATIRYVKIAKGTITAYAKLDGDADALKAKLDEDGKVRFPVNVVLKNSEDLPVCEMVVDWHLKKLG